MESWLLGALLAGNVGLFLRLELCQMNLVRQLQSGFDILKSTLQDKNIEVSTDLVDNIEERMLETIGNMRQPTALDHVAGAFVNVMQMREQWKIQKEASQLNDMINPPNVGNEYGAPTNEN